MSESRRIVVFSGDLSYAVRKGIIEIDNDAPAALLWLVLLQVSRKTFRQLLRSQWLNLIRNGWRWIPYQLSDLIDRVAARRSAAAPSRPNRPGAEFSLEALLARPNVRLLRVDDLHGESVLRAVREFAPDLGLSLAAPILRRPLFSIPALGTINLHKGKLPEFRGMPPAFWELWKDQRTVGCSIHLVDDKLDAGDVIAESCVERARYSTVRGLQLRLDDVGNELLRGAVAAMLAGSAQPRSQPAGRGATHRKPTLAQQAELRRRLTPAQPFATRPKYWCKEAFAAAAYGAFRLGTGRLLTPRISVLLYHRVSDDVRDNLTVGIEQFDRQMALLHRHCEVLSIEQVIACEVVPRSKRPLVAVTFDDGYLDNYLHAAPSLRRHGVPAAFFVSTGIVSSGGRFPHDLSRGNPPIPLMTWEQMRAMRRWGFTIGSHTVNHVDCAAEPEAIVREELARSRDDLRRELGVEQVVFAYPYGGREHMTAERLEWVKQAGYVACLSAYGGANVGRVDRYNVLRRGIHHAFSDRALIFECLGLT
jgi:peptidoglycan/xylan/chitin deacetylase (PgdA/CDA1 family)